MAAAVDRARNLCRRVNRALEDWEGACRLPIDAIARTSSYPCIDGLDPCTKPHHRCSVGSRERRRYTGPGERGHRSRVSLAARRCQLEGLMNQTDQTLGVVRTRTVRTRSRYLKPGSAASGEVGARWGDEEAKLRVQLEVAVSQ